MIKGNVKGTALIHVENKKDMERSTDPIQPRHNAARNGNIFSRDVLNPFNLNIKPPITKQTWSVIPKTVNQHRFADVSEVARQTEYKIKTSKHKKKDKKKKEYIYTYIKQTNF